MSYFREVIDDDGNKSYVQVEDVLTEIEAEDPDRIRATSTYQATKDESVKRRQKIKELEELARGADSEPGESDGADTPADMQETVVQPVAIDKDQLFTEFTKRLAEEQAAAQKAAAEREAQLKGLLTEHKLPEALLDVLDSHPEPAKAAKVLAESSYRFDDQQGGGAADTQTTFENIIGGANRLLGLDDE